jgi:ferredoxin/flavodoxin---NADP+ reductase
MIAKWLEGRVIENRHWTDALFSLRVEAPRLNFQAGQFVRIGLEPTLVRAFSFVNPPEDPVLEFYGIVVPEGPLSPRLAQLHAGDRLLVAPNPAGFLVLSEVPDAETLWLVSTGTGLAPFLSLLRTTAIWSRFRNVVLVHAVRYARELAYRELIGEILRSHHNAFHYVRFVSRETVDAALAGRIPAAIRDGRLEAAAGLKLDPRSHVMLCGNPQMLKDASAALVERGLRKHRRRSPGHITVESFW